MADLEDIASKPHVYSWSTKVDFVLNSAGGFKGLEAESTAVPWQQPFVLTLRNTEIHPNLAGAGASGHQLVLDAAETACEAEELGKRLTLALLKLAADKHWGMRLSWQDTPLPCRVVDRTSAPGARLQAFLSVTGHISIEEFAELLEATFNRVQQTSYRLLLAMELLASARFETDNRAKLVLSVSALEAVSEQRDLTEALEPAVAALVSVARDTLADKALQDSVIGRIREFRRESVRQAIRRTVRSAGCSESDLASVEEAYGARSKILHEGRRIPEIGLIVGTLEGVLDKILNYELERSGA